MRVRHKQTGTIYVVTGQGDIDNEHVWLGEAETNNDGITILRHHDYEPVPDERWEDVTRDIKIGIQGNGIFYPNLDVPCVALATNPNIPTTYRLVKRSLWECCEFSPVFMGSLSSTLIAFLKSKSVLQVERKVVDAASR